jgi:hypothetical protein
VADPQNVMLKDARSPVNRSAACQTPRKEKMASKKDIADRIP